MIFHEGMFTPTISHTSEEVSFSGENTFSCSFVIVAKVKKWVESKQKQNKIYEINRCGREKMTVLGTYFFKYEV